MFAGALLLVFVFAIAVLIGVRVARGEPAGAASSEAKCGRCGYIVRGISSLTCPECGSDLREVGIIAPGAQSPSWMPVVGMGLLWSLVVFILASVLATAMYHFMPRWVKATHVATLSGPSSGAYQSVIVTASDDYRVGADPVSDPYEPKVAVELYLKDGTMATLRADVDAEMYSYRTPAGQDVRINGALDGPAVAAWLKEWGVTAPADEAAQIALQVNAQPPHRAAHSFSSTASGYSMGPFKSTQQKWNGERSGIDWSALLPPVLGLIAWVLGLRWIVARYGPHARARASAEPLAR